MSFVSYRKFTFNDAQSLYSFYSTIETKKILYEKLVNQIGSEYADSFSGINIHEIYNHIIKNYYPNEAIIKSGFINRMLLKGNNHVTIFELPIVNSRADLCKINEESVVYEIKTDLDNLNRLPKQIHDYAKIFDKTYVICSESKVKQIYNCLPTESGIYSYRFVNSGKLVFNLERNAQKSNELNSREQLKILRKKDLITFFPKTEILSRDCMIDYLISIWGKEQTNNVFKTILKKRYQEQWNFFKLHHKEILEIDYQWFFRNSVCPEAIYN